MWFICVGWEIDAILRSFTLLHKNTLFTGIQRIEYFRPNARSEHLIVFSDQKQQNTPIESAHFSSHFFVLLLFSFAREIGKHADMFQRTKVVYSKRAWHSIRFMLILSNRTASNKMNYFFCRLPSNEIDICAIGIVWTVRWTTNKANKCQYLTSNSPIIMLTTNIIVSGINSRVFQRRNNRPYTKTI